jgi:glycosyltransferase involved in cell wall biosynthesis
MNKIIIVGPASPLRGGISDFNEALAKALVLKNKDVEIISFSLQYPSIFFPGKSQNKTTNENDLTFKISPIINSINPLSWRKAAKHIAHSKPDKVFIRFWMPFFAPCLGFIGSFLKKKKINVSGIVDNAIAHEKRWGDKQLVNFFLKSCNNHITLSKKVKQDILSINATTTVKALFHPIYDTYKPLTDKKSALNKLNLKEGKYILFFGLIRKYKGLDLAIKAMAEKQIIKMKIKLIIAGEFYESEKDYQKLINQLKLNNIIIYNKFIEDSDVPSFFSASNLVILPYTSATQSGVTQLAMHYNKPMITTNVGGLSEIITHGKDGYICSPDSNQLSNYILKYFSETDNENKMSNALSIKKELFSWEQFTNEIV